ncbi:uncharacterized protein [Spinacia oleracea]|uniref:Uncharacterized protein isoform X1 n=1 Tax=Spinacia oleracea TaxID=3562 RepID=A0ABM3R002_SPIOL|nr:uncharacterized protein LOC130463731 isoform X1 [Spinacia oleracea]
MSAAVEQTPQPFILRLQQSLVSCSKILTIKKPRTIQSLFSLIFTLSFETLLLIRLLSMPFHLSCPKLFPSLQECPRGLHSEDCALCEEFDVVREQWAKFFTSKYLLLALARLIELV